MVDDLRDDGDLASRGAGLEEDHCNLTSISLRHSQPIVLRTTADLDEALEVGFLHQSAVSIVSPSAAVAAAAAAKAAASPAGCPFHANADAASTSEVKKAPTPGGFDYEKFYTDELDKKHKDASYRYFNNINRMASKFPIAHTGDPKDEVEVWCANDYLGMGNNPVVLETMQCVSNLLHARFHASIITEH